MRGCLGCLECSMFWSVYSLHIQKFTEGTSLVVQWLRLYIPNAGVTDSIPGQRTKNPKPAQPKKKKKKNIECYT